MGIKKLLAGLGASLLLTMSAPALVMAASTTVTPLNNQGWVFNPDPANASPYEFNEAEASTGDGSLYALPISSTAAHKFIAEKNLGIAVNDLSSVSYDFLIDGNGDAADANQFYLNVYANFGESSPTKFYDCRYDVVATEGSTTAFSTVTFDPALSYPVATRNTSPHTCPASPSGMQDLSVSGTAVIRAFTLNIGDTSANDAGLAGYLDNVVVAAVNGTTTYDFELTEPTVKVTIDKYIDGAKATATSANNSAFPMVSSWTTNTGSGTGEYALGTTGFNSASPYQAITSDMSLGSSYSTNEVTSGAVVAATCTPNGAPFALAGYSVGNTLAEAQAAPTVTTAPNFTDLQTDKFVIVRNISCTTPTNIRQCFGGGFRNFTNPTFRNLGQCVAFVVSNRGGNSTSVNIKNTNNVNVRNNNSQRASSGNASSRANTTAGSTTSGSVSNASSFMSSVTVLTNVTF